MTAGRFEVRWGSATHAGLRRRNNEDALLTRSPIFLVADGMGGHQRGRDASDLVIRAFDQATGGSWVTPVAIGQATRAATAWLREIAESGPGAPGSTVTGVGLADHDGRPSWLVFNIGDSRTYRLSDGHLEQVTVDHSRRQELLDIGLDELEVAARTPTHVITRAIGAGQRQDPMADQWLLPAAAGDRMLLCSDGLTGELTDELITAILQSCENPGDAAQQLVAAAVTAGGRDNVTVVVIDALGVERADGVGVDPLGGGTTLNDDVLGDDEERTVPGSVFDDVTLPREGEAS